MTRLRTRAPDQMAIHVCFAALRSIAPSSPLVALVSLCLPISGFPAPFIISLPPLQAPSSPLLSHVVFSSSHRVYPRKGKMTSPTSQLARELRQQRYTILDPSTQNSSGGTRGAPE